MTGAAEPSGAALPAPSPGVRRMTVSTAPQEGESLLSWMERLAGRQQTTLARALTACGLLDPERRKLGGIGIAPPAGQLSHLHHATGVAPERITATCLERYDGVVLDLTGECDGGSPTARSLEQAKRVGQVANYQWLHVGHSPYCPQCLHEDGYWRLRWRLPWSFACVRHRRLLTSSCSKCGNLPRLSVRPLGIPSVRDVVPDVLRCLAPVDAGQGARSGPCDHLYATGEPPAGGPLEADGDLLRLQRSLDEEIDGPPSGSGMERFELRRTIAGLLFGVGTDRDLPADLPPACQEAWSGYAERRDRLAEEGMAGVARGVSRKSPPTDTALAGAVLAATEPYLQLEAFGELFERHASHLVRSKWRKFSLPEAHAAKSEQVLEGRRRRRFWKHAAEGLTPEQVPRSVPLAWLEPVTELAGFKLAHHRLGVTVAVEVLGLSGFSRPRAAEALGLEGDDALLGRRDSALRSRLSAMGGGRLEQYDQYLLKLHERLVSEEIDYRARARQLSELGPAPHEACPPWTRQGRKATDVQRERASMWTWNRLAGESALRAPVLAGGSLSAGTRHKFAAYAKGLSFGEQRRLEEWGTEVLRGAWRESREGERLQARLNGRDCRSG